MNCCIYDNKVTGMCTCEDEQGIMCEKDCQDYLNERESDINIIGYTMVFGSWIYATLVIHSIISSVILGCCINYYCEHHW